MVPYSDKAKALNLGAKWDAKVKQWYITDEFEQNGDSARIQELITNYDYCNLAVPYNQKDRAKALGAMWNNNSKKWYTLKCNPKFDKLTEFLEDEKPLEDFDNEDYDIEIPYITISDVNHLPDAMDYKDFLRLDTYVKSRSEGCCQLCLESGFTSSTELFTCEVYEYIPEEERKKLIRLFAACKNCRNLYRFGIKNNSLEYLKSLTDMDDEEATKFISLAKDKKNELDQIKWNLDLSLITDNELKLK